MIFFGSLTGGTIGVAAVVVFCWPPVASAAGGARGYDCGPERSLRTAPLSSSSQPSAVPSDSLGRIYTPRAPPAADATSYSVITSPALGANRVLGVLAGDRVGTEDFAGPPKPAARAAFFGIWGEVGRDAEGAREHCRRCSAWRGPGCIGRSPTEESAMHRGAPRGRISEASSCLPRQPFFPSIRRRAKPVTRTPPSTARRPLSTPRLDGTPANNPPPARSANTPSQDTA